MNESKDLQLLKITIPTLEKYEKIKHQRLKKLILSVYTSLEDLNFMWLMKKEVFFKIKKSFYPFQERYDILDPFDNKIGSLRYGGKAPYCYYIDFDMSKPFTVKYKKENEQILFTLDPLPLILKGDSVFTNFQVINSKTKKEIARLTYYSYGNKGMTYEIEWKIASNQKEILIAIIASKLIQFHTMD